MTTTIDPRKTALLSLHLVNDIANPEGKFGAFFGAEVVRRDVIAQAARMLDLARAQQLAVIHVAVRFQPGHTDLVANSPLLGMVRELDALVEGTWGAEFVDAVKPQPGEAVVTHQQVGAFHASTLDALLQERGIEHLLLMGVVTNNIVEHSARNAVDRGYTLSIIEDCCSAATAEIHAASIENLRLLGQVVTLETLIPALG